MILPGFPVLFSSGIVFPVVTVNRANLGGGGIAYGYIRSGGHMAGLMGVDGGSLSGTLVPGFVTDMVAGIVGGEIQISIMGNCAALLSGVTVLIDNGTPLPLADPFAFDGDVTTAYTTTGNTWSETGNRTVQLA